MRVPYGFMASSIGQQLSTASDRLAQLQQQVTSGLRIQHPSDDPLGAVHAASLQAGLDRIQQYQDTITSANTWLKSEDSTLTSITNTVQQINTIAQQANNSIPTSDRTTLVDQIEQWRTSLVQLANTNDGTHYIFGGFQTTTTPFTDAAGTVTYHGDNGAIKYAISDSNTLQINHSGAEVFNIGGAADPSMPDLFTTISNLETSITNNDQAGLQTGLSNMSKYLTNLSTLNGQTGIREQQATLANNQLTLSNTVLTEMLSNTQDVDITQAAVQLKEQQNVYQAASYVASTLSNGGLLSYLR